jgi:gliding motility-associated-like protein
MLGKGTYLKAISKTLLLVLILLLHMGVQAQLPDIPDLIRVTVDHSDNGVLIEWEASTSQGIMSYYIYEKVGDIFTWLDSVPANTFQYKDLSLGKGSLPYAVTAIDSSLNESLFGQNYQRIVYLSTEFDLCTQSNILQWSDYEGWEGNISGYRVYGGIAGSPLQELDLLPATTNSYSHSGLDPNTDYVYYIETTHTPTGNISLSALDTVNTVYPEAPSYLILDHVNVVDEASVELQFTADISGQVSGFRIMRRSNPGSAFLEVETLWDISGPTQVVQDQVATGSISYEYMIESLFQPAGCPTSIVMSVSNQGNNILLSNTLNDQIITLSWTPYEEYEPGLAGYLIQRRMGGGDFVDIETVGPFTNQWQETIQSLDNGYQAGEIQYRVIALSNPYNGGSVEQSISNLSTAVVETQMQVPNAFTPGSNDINAEFKPLMDFAPEEYLMIVVDRGGRKMFETTDPGEGWDGRFQGGSFVDEAVYVYYIQYTDYTGLFQTFTGNVTVLYP